MFSEEQNKALDEKLTSLGEKLLTQLGETMNKSLSGMAKRLIVDEVPKAIANQFAPLEEKLNGLQFDEDKQRSLLRSEMDGWLEELNKQATLEDQGSETESEAEGKKGGKKGEKQATERVVEAAALQDLRNQIAEQTKVAEAMKQRVEAAEKQAADERRVRETIAEQQRLAQMDEKVLQELRGKVRPNTERQLLTLLKNDGILVEDKDKNEFLIKTKDEYGLDTMLGISAAAADIIRQNYPHYEDVRPGTGTSAMPGGRESGTSSHGKWFDGGSKMPEIQDMLDPNNLTEMMKELDAAMKR
jgi:hypothetical protein